MLKVIPQFDCSVDESGDKHQQRSMCVAAFLASLSRWTQLEKRWLTTLAKEGVKYFETTECKYVQGGFGHLKRKYGTLEQAKLAARKLNAELTELLVGARESWVAFCICVDIPEYKEVLSEYPIARSFFSPRPIVSAYAQLMYEVAHVTRRETKGQSKVAFVIDLSSQAPLIMDEFRCLQENHPRFASTAKSVVPLDDKDTPPLQMADLLASLAREQFLVWQQGTKKRRFRLTGPLVGRFERIGVWDKNHMIRILQRTLTSPRYISGRLVPRIKPERRLSKGERKQLRRLLAAQHNHERN